ncbi:hypothetical protein GOODEAATRI_027034, partial [Goodea atripinnis]
DHNAVPSLPSSIDSDLQTACFEGPLLGTAELLTEGLLRSVADLQTSSGCFVLLDSIDRLEADLEAGDVRICHFGLCYY